MQTVRLQPTAKGLTWVRLAIAMARSNEDVGAGAAIAKTRWGADSAPGRIMEAGGPPMLMLNKANIPAGATASGNWAAELIDLESAATEFFSLVRERSLLGKIEGLRRVPLRTRLVGAATGFSAAWVAEGAAKPIGRASYDEEELPSRKVVSLCVVTNELLESLDPSSELLIRNDMANAMVEAIDASFIDPANAGTPDVEPASVTNSATAVPVVGTGDMDDVRESISRMVKNFTGDLERAVFIGRPELFVWLGLNSFSFSEHIGARGGTLAGIPAIPSKGLPVDAGGNQQLVLLDPDAIALGEAEMDLRTSKQGTIEMRDDPTQNATTPTASQVVSLWQTDCTAILSEKRLNFQAGRAGGVSVMTGLVGPLES